ncbi:MAG: di-trans,poly-cis-decaprenylcistransferase [Candidatus Buchananbacteria bacterium]|nr:di-trans,poly-cis-decaprenylcistransferase [Candidatus Buchananbacteria bacterium]
MQHLAIIMDGNRRWAKQHGLPTLEGHRRGYDKVKAVGEWCLDRGIKYLTVYAFSTENWNRAPAEIEYLMKLFEQALTNELDEFVRLGLRLKIIGERLRFSTAIQQAIERAEAATAAGDRGTLQLGLNYGGRLEIIEACKRLAVQTSDGATITEESFAAQLWTAGTPDPDLIIRTGGEQRLSNFLLWQSAYSELYFTPTYWPDFTETDLDAAIAEYDSRQRRFGK